MNKINTLLLAAVASVSAASASDVIVATDAYRWSGDSIIQGPFVATAPTSNSIVSTYSAQPGYFMPVNKEWHQKNDISKYPQLTTSNRLHEAIYNMGLDEMVNAVEPDTTLRTGKEWPGVWTRDVSYSILLSMGYMQPEASRISLEKKVDPLGRIVQDTGSGGAWPISTDREIWTVAAYELYLITGDKQWLEYVYPIAKRSLETDWEKVMNPRTGLVKGETSFIDWREQSHPRWMQTADITESQALSTSIVHARAWWALAEMAQALGKKKEETVARERSQAIAEAVNTNLWMDDQGLYAMYLYGRNFPIINRRSDTLGEALSIMWDVADTERAKKMTASLPTTPFGAAVFYPQIADIPPYHNNANWPWVGAWWTLANAKAGNEEGVIEGFGSLFRPAALFATNKENFRLDNGDIATELNSSNMLWCLSGNLALTHRILFGLDFRKDGLHINPFVPQALGDTRSLTDFKYRNATLNITVSGYGDKIASFKVNGKTRNSHVVPTNAKGVWNIDIVMDNQPIEPIGINRRPNAATPLTPLVTLTASGEPKEVGQPLLDLLTWQPIEYIDHYVVIRDGKPVATTTQTTFDALQEGEYQVIGVSGDGLESFASEPVSNRNVYRIELGSASSLTSPEVSYQPKEPLAGAKDGFAEIDHNSKPIDFNAIFSQPGRYSVRARYANGNGPVNTENKAAIRTLTLDGKEVGTLVMPQRGVGNWNDWGYSNTIIFPASEGSHVFEILFTPDDENMNLKTNHAIIDSIEIVRIGD